MNAGLMDVLITIQSPAYADSAYGKGVKPTSWSDNGTFWGRVTYNGGGESTAADKKEYRETVTIQGHYVDMSTIALIDRLSFDSKLWNVSSKGIVGRSQYIRLEAVAID